MEVQVAGAKLGEVLVRANIITHNQLEHALKEQKKEGKPLGSVLIELGYVRSEREILDALSRYYGVEVVEPLLNINPEVVKLVPPEIARRYMVFPIAKEGGILKLAMLNPLDIMALEDVRIATGFTPKPCLTSYETLVSLVERYYPSINLEEVVRELQAEGRRAERWEEGRESLLESVDHAPTVRFVNSLIVRSIERRASDIHIEPQSDKVVVRHRVDSVLFPVLTLSKAMGLPIVARIKVMAGLDVSERRLPQEGSIRTRVGTKEYDLRVSTMSSIHGESVAIRILDRFGGLLSLDELGLFPEDKAKVKRFISQPYGLILVTGPTGAGKTTTLYAILQELNDGSRKIITIEEPVEYEIPGVTQVNIRPEIGLTYSEVLKFSLRHDPDVILVGEIRDSQTAELAARAVLTGHLVLASLHTSDALSVITRLVDLGVSPFLAVFTSLGIISQRLIRLNCLRCLKPYEPLPEILERAGLKSEEASKATFMKGAGCHYCDQTGYYGRTGVFEILEIDDRIRSMATAGVTSSHLKKVVREIGFRTLKESALQLALRGKTTVEEVLRVSGHL